MTGSTSDMEHLSVAMTTENVGDVTQTTAANAATSSSSRGMTFYFQCAAIVIGVVGTVANAIILYGFIGSKQHKKHVLIFYQNVLDFLSSLTLAITYLLQLCNLHSTGLGEYLVCVVVENEYLLWCIITASKMNLMSVTIERYLKVVHAVWSKNKLRNWMIYSAMAFALIFGFLHMSATTFTTSAVIDGVCYAYAFWESPYARLAYGIFSIFFFYVLVFILFVFCYWRILVVVRRQARVMAGHSAAGSSTTQSQSQSHQIQTNIIKTLILVSAAFAICDLPVTVYNVMGFAGMLSSYDAGYYVSMFVSFLYICANPFIYATKFDPVKRVLLSLIPCKNTAVQPIEAVEMSARKSTKGTGQLHK